MVSIFVNVIFTLRGTLIGGVIICKVVNNIEFLVLLKYA